MRNTNKLTGSGFLEAISSVVDDDLEAMRQKIIADYGLEYLPDDTDEPEEPPKAPNIGYIRKYLRDKYE